ncbi:DUF1153 domain-containing protein [Dongshaea marina]|uniref:DUF1153 domain-containing protein n=1 Tax=Dongshaea marina TaxID=2047966 RepID=UPI000D3EC86C|nr:DUF1153 domain-containing protein [Dongshaea marina]
MTQQTVDKAWSAERKTALVLEILKEHTSITDASEKYHLSPTEIEHWLHDAQRGIENALRANPYDIR